MPKIGGVDHDKCANGVWFTYEDTEEHLIARSDNKRFQNRLEQLKRPHRRRIEKGDQVLEFDLVMRAMSETIHLGWKGVVDQEDKTVMYSPDESYKMLKDYPEFRDWVTTCAKEESAYFKDKVGKSQKPTDGT